MEIKDQFCTFRVQQSNSVLSQGDSCSTLQVTEICVTYNFEPELSAVDNGIPYSFSNSEKNEDGGF